MFSFTKHTVIHITPNRVLERIRALKTKIENNNRQEVLSREGEWGQLFF